MAERRDGECRSHALDAGGLQDLCRRLAGLTDFPLPASLPDTPAESLEILQAIVERCERRCDRQGGAEHAERLKNEFIMNISHELRTPLGSIEGFAMALLRGMDRKADDSHEEMPADTRRHFVRIISQEARRLGELIEDMLEITEIEARPMDANPTSFPAQEALLEALATFRAHWGEDKAAPVKMELDPLPAGPPVYANQQAVRDILRHLLDNAHKFSGGQEIVVGAESAPGQGSFKQGDRTRIWVRDRGVGIPRSEQPRLFRKFHRIGTTARTVPGTGLGLAIVKTLVLQNKGAISVASDVGRGATFTVLLPSRESAWKRR